MLVTVEEKSYGYSRFYRFVFKNDYTKQEVTAIIQVQGYIPDRADFFRIDVDTVFASADDGMYSYQIFTYGNSIDTPFDNQMLVEVGLMTLVSERGGPVVYETSSKKYVTYG